MPFDHFTARPPGQAGPRAPLTRMARTLHSCPLRSGRAPCARTGLGRPGLTPPGPAPRCAPPALQLQSLKCWSSTQQVQVRSTGVPHRRVGCGGDAGPFAVVGNALSYPTGTAWHQAPRATRGHTTRQNQRRWGGSTPTTSLLSSRGCKWGPTPLSSILPSVNK
jgi:hypothetical protein